MVIETERLLLRDFEEADWQTLLSYQDDPEYLRFSPWVYRTEIDARSFVRMFMNWCQEYPRKKFQFAIILKSEQRLIGNCGVRKEMPFARLADLGYELDRRYWGHGYATEAAQALLRFGFEELDLHRIWAHCIRENTASAHVLEKIGMKYEGCLQENEWMKGRWWSTSLYAILEREWLLR